MQQETNGKKQNDNQSCRIITTKHILKEHRIYLLDEISEPYLYTDFFDLLRESEPEQTQIKIIINSPGGYLNTAIQMCAAIKNCPCPVSALIEGEAHSAASVIFLACDILEVATGSEMLCHYYSGFDYGKGHELKSASDFRDHHLKSFFKESYAGFLTDEELERMFKGEDFWFDHKEIVKRMYKKKDYVIALAKKNKVDEEIKKPIEAMTQEIIVPEEKKIKRNRKNLPKASK